MPEIELLRKELAELRARIQRMENSQMVFGGRGVLPNLPLSDAWKTSPSPLWLDAPTLPFGKTGE